MKNHTADDGNSILTLYFYVGETVQNANLIDAGRIGEQLANKVDTNFNNMNPSQTAKNTIVGWGMPDYTTKVVIPTTVGVIQIADEDIVFHGGVGGGSFTVRLCNANGDKIEDIIDVYSSATSYGQWSWTPIIKKGSYFKVERASGTSYGLYKYYLYKEGSNN